MATGVLNSGRTVSSCIASGMCAAAAVLPAPLRPGNIELRTSMPRRRCRRCPASPRSRCAKILIAAERVATASASANSASPSTSTADIRCRASMRVRSDHGIRFEAADRRHHVALNPLQRGCRCRLRNTARRPASCSRRGRVEAIGELDPQPVDAHDPLRVRKTEPASIFAINAWASPSAPECAVRRADAVGQRVEHHADRRGKESRAVARCSPSSNRTSVRRRTMAAHFAGERRSDLFHPGLDQRVAGLPHLRDAAMPLDPRLQIAGRLDVVDDRCPRIAR